MDDDSFLVATKQAIIEAIQATTDADLLDLISKILILENADQTEPAGQAG